MRWRGREQSTNIEDRRHLRGRRAKQAGLGGGAMVVAVIIALLFGVDPRQMLQMAGNVAGGNQRPLTSDGPTPGQPVNPAEEEAAAFVAVVLKDTEDVWHRLFRDSGKQYREPVLVLYSGQTQSACGYGSAAMGPFYCPADHQMYLDLSFFEDLKRRHSAPGDFAQAYVIAHEVGHHVQNLLGISRRVREMQRGLSKEEANELSVRLELQADFFAGVWAHHAQQLKQILEQGDIEEALNAATAIGDDRLQMEAQGYVVPESFTHGTSAQRMRWFRAGLETGDLEQGDTFSVRDP